MAGKNLTLDQYFAHMGLVAKAWAISDEGQIPTITTGSNEWGPWMMTAYRWPRQTVGAVIPNHPQHQIILMAYDTVEDIPWLGDPPSQ